MENENLEAWAFGDSPEMADKLLQLVLDGKKTATCGALCDYEYCNDPIPKEGTFEIILDGKGKAACKIENTQVRIINYNNVNAEFAAAEGEGDLSLSNWREMHETFFKRTLPNIKKEFVKDMPLVCVNFKVVEIFDR